LTKRKIVLIGAGKIAYSLTSALQNSGYEIQCIISRRLNSAKSLANKFTITNYSTSFNKISPEIDIFFITVPDGEIKNVADKLSKVNRDFKQNICIHFSGVETISALSSLKKKGCVTGALHIIRPFSSKSIVDIKNSPASVEAEEKRAKSFLVQLCRKLKLKPHMINSDEKVFHHLAAVHSSNFLVGNLFNAFSLIDSKGDQSKAILKKTTQSALDNVFKLSPAKALSGPVDRGDVYAVKKHISELDRKIKSSKDHRLKLIRLGYIIQSLSLLEVVKSKYGKLDKKHKEIEIYFKKLMP